jgi:hypothetical protein
VELAVGKLFAESEKAEGGWLWLSDRIDNRTEVVLGYCLGEFVVERVKGRMGSIAGEVVPTTWRGLLLKIRIVAEAGCSLDPIFF